MNDKKLNQLFAAARHHAARNDSAPAPAADSPDALAAAVLRAIRREPPAMPSAPPSVADHLNALFPRLALAALAVILLCLAADWSLSSAGLPGVGDGAAQISSQYFFNPGDL